jgi:hypothetical protein
VVQGLRVLREGAGGRVEELGDEVELKSFEPQKAVLRMTFSLNGKRVECGVCSGAEAQVSTGFLMLELKLRPLKRHHYRMVLQFLTSKTLSKL